jgi:hypothetical protein
MNYKIKDASGTVTNTIVATEEFVEANHAGRYELVEVETIVPIAAEEARMWRDMELSSTDHAAMVPDYSNRDAIMAYRIALRNWPSTEDFPATKPEM